MAVLKVKQNGEWVDIPAIVGATGPQGPQGIKGDRGDTVIIAEKYENLTFPVEDGTYCIYNNLPYVAKQNISATETFNSSHWDRVSFEDEISDLNNVVQDIVVVSDTQPSSANNKIWVKPTGSQSIQVPTTEEFTSAIGDVSRALTNLDAESIPMDSSAQTPVMIADTLGNVSSALTFQGEKTLGIEKTYLGEFSVSSGSDSRVIFNTDTIASGKTIILRLTDSITNPCISNAYLYFNDHMFGNYYAFDANVDHYIKVTTDVTKIEVYIPNHKAIGDGTVSVRVDIRSDDFENSMIEILSDNVNTVVRDDYIAENTLGTVEENWCTGDQTEAYTTSTFSGFATSWSLSEAKYVKNLKFIVRSRDEANITEIRVRIEDENFVLEKSIFVNIGDTATTVTFPVNAVLPAGTVWLGIAANKQATFKHANGTGTFSYAYWTNGDTYNLDSLKMSGGSTKRLYITAECYNNHIDFPRTTNIVQEELAFAEKVLPYNFFNVDDTDSFKKGWWYYETTIGNTVTLQDVSQYQYTGIKVETYGVEQVTLGTFPTFVYPPNVYWIGCVDEDMKLLSYQIINHTVPFAYSLATGTKYLLISLATKSDDVLNAFVVTSEQSVSKYEKGEPLKYLLHGCLAEFEHEEDLYPNVKIKAPDSYNLVVGDTFQLFKKGIISATNPDLFDMRFICTKGSAYETMFEITPTTAEDLTLQLAVYDMNRVLVDSKNVTLKVRAKASSPSSNKNILCVGDSLTTGGAWPVELKRRLTGSGGTPVADGLTNVTFIGTRQANGTNYEGYGGWKFSDYNSETVDTNVKIITCTHDKTEADDQHSVYKDGTNATWKLETIESGQIKIIAISGEGTNFPATGTLTWVSGGTNHSDIVYTASENGPGNPFWNVSEGKVDFGAYATSLGVSSIDYVYVLLGWNNAATPEADYKEQAQIFIDNVHDAFPNAKIVLMGLQIPARDGLGVNYGATGTYTNYYGLMNYVFNLDQWYKDLVEDNENVYFFNLSGQFDTENNMPTQTVQVNTRNTATKTRQSNGVHPATAGYLQIADAVYRHIHSLL